MEIERLAAVSLCAQEVTKLEYEEFSEKSELYLYQGN
jgi:hypothetical protein